MSNFFNILKLTLDKKDYLSINILINELYNLKNVVKLLDVFKLDPNEYFMICEIINDIYNQEYLNKIQRVINIIERNLQDNNEIKNLISVIHFSGKLVNNFTSCNINSIQVEIENSKIKFEKFNSVGFALKFLNYSLIENTIKYQKLDSDNKKSLSNLIFSLKEKKFIYKIITKKEYKNNIDNEILIKWLDKENPTIDL